jgi:hypothetical protein
VDDLKAELGLERLPALYDSVTQQLWQGAAEVGERLAEGAETMAERTARAGRTRRASGAAGATRAAPQQLAKRVAFESDDEAALAKSMAAAGFAKAPRTRAEALRAETEKETA